jgi:nicotinate dehydrogenase subunit A
MGKQVSLRVNGKDRQVESDEATPLLYVLRNDLGLKSAKYGCGLAQCGSCTVQVDGRPVQSCSVTLASIGAAAVVTLEAIGTPEAPHPLQAAFLAEQAAQCGYCTSGMIMAAKALLEADPSPSDATIRQALQDNLCRCGAHPRILRAVRRAAAEMRR